VRWRFSKLDWPYAVGELIIVTVGVLIALAIDQWNSDRLERAEEIVLVDRFIADLRIDLDGISLGLRLAPEKAERLQRLYIALSTDQRPSDLATFLDDVVEGTRIGWNQPRSRRHTFDEVLASGRLTLVRDAGIRGSIAEYYASTSNRRNRIEERETNFPGLSYQLVPRVAEFEADVELIDEEVAWIIDRAFNSSMRDSVVAEMNFAQFVMDQFEVWQEGCTNLLFQLETYRSAIE
jgi:hypothetical protein